MPIESQKIFAEAAFVRKETEEKKAETRGVRERLAKPFGKVDFFGSGSVDVVSEDGNYKMSFDFVPLDEESRKNFTDYRIGYDEGQPIDKNVIDPDKWLSTDRILFSINGVDYDKYKEQLELWGKFQKSDFFEEWRNETLKKMEDDETEEDYLFIYFTRWLEENEKNPEFHDKYFPVSDEPEPEPQKSTYYDDDDGDESPPIGNRW
jgi:hypothetical protein